MSATPGGTTSVIHLEGTFDLPAARLLESTLARSAGSAVRVDFARVREFHDFAVAVLAQALKRHGDGRAKVEGLRMHHVRLLRYFGVEPAVFRPEGEPTSR